MNEVWQCNYCAHQYVVADGDPAHGVPPGTPLEDLPEDWLCPDCGAGKHDYARVDD